MSNAKKINICCRDTIYQYFKEYINSFYKYLNANLIIEKDLDNYKYSFEEIYLFCQTIPIKVLDNTSIKKYLINTEQLSQDKWNIYIKNILSKDIKVIDYSIENIILINNPNMIYLSYQYNQDEVDKLIDLIDNTKKIYDVAFVGLLTKRRLNILNKLRDNNITINYIQSFDENIRDKNIAKCKLLLNIHANDDYTIFESLRCDRWTFSCMHVISESSSDAVCNDSIIFKKYDELVEYIINYLKEYHLFGSDLGKIDNMKNNRLLDLSNLINIF